jgi:hypothetical protein
MTLAKVIDAMLAMIFVYREMGGSMKKLTDALAKADEEGRDLTSEELAEVREDAQESVNRL